MFEALSQTHELPGIARILKGEDSGEDSESEIGSDDEPDAPRTLCRGLAIGAMLALRHDAYYPEGALPDTWEPKLGPTNSVLQRAHPSLTLKCDVATNVTVQVWLYSLAGVTECSSR